MEDRSSFWLKLSAGDWISLGSSILIVGVAYGLLKGDVSTITTTVQSMQAAQAVRDNLQDENMRNLKNDLQLRLDRIEGKLDRVIENGQRH